MKTKKLKTQKVLIRDLQTSNTIENKLKSIDKEENLEKIYQNLAKAVQLNTTLPSSID